MFSGTVKIGDLNDFIAPSQACVVNLNGGKIDVEDAVEEVGVAIRPRSRGGTAAAPTPPSSEPVKVTLQDCLACSGCVTTAEAVLLEAQSGAALDSALGDERLFVVVSLSPQSMASLARARGIDADACTRRVAAALKRAGAGAVLSTSGPREVALAEAAAEFVARYRAREASRSGLGELIGAKRTNPSPSLPMLCSACPGWICYAEKSHGEYVLPFLSSVKSPQAVAGTLIKRLLAPPRRGDDPRVLFHCSVMPCYDKKLEASRVELRGTEEEGAAGAPETDCVVATSELAALLDGWGADVADCEAPEAPLDAPGPGLAASLRNVRGGSGGHLEHVFRSAARELFGAEVPPQRLETVRGRNADVAEVRLCVGGEVKLRFAYVYGFRNIQGLLRGIRLKTCHYDYVEVMACPSGCLNGGGQMPLVASPVQGLPHPTSSVSRSIAAAEALDEMETTMARAAEGEWEEGPELSEVERVYQSLRLGRPGSDEAQPWFHTTFQSRKAAAVNVSDW